MLPIRKEDLPGSVGLREGRSKQRKVNEKV
jgi:hypothetical protein